MTVSSSPPTTPLALSANALTVLQKRYLVKDASGKPTESVEDLFWRVATVIAEVDRRYGASHGAVQEVAEAFYRLMTERRFEPNSPTLMNAGRPLGQLSACFVLPVEDALSNGRDGIYDTLRSMALIHQSGGGTGFGFSRLRPRGSMVRSTTGVASGPVSFMKLYDASTDAVKQGGTRRGANMGILRVDHPDLMEFITCKEDLTQVTNFNISVAVTEKFMQALKAGTKYDLVDPVTGQVTGQLDATMVWDKMILGAWRTGEPGVFFIDEANRYNPVPHLGSYEATNPCLTGDTMILTVEGPRRFDELAADGRDVLVYAVNRETNEPVVRWMRRPHKTRTNAEVLEITFDSGLVVRATPDHSFISIRGEKVQARDLKAGQSVSAFTLSHHASGHLRVTRTKRRSDKVWHRFAHRMVAESVGIDTNGVIHHQDEDPQNNQPENLAPISGHAEHNLLHHETRVAAGFTGRGRVWTEEMRERQSERLRQHFVEHGTDALREERVPRLDAPCTVCGTPVALTARELQARLANTQHGVVHCSRRCSNLDRDYDHALDRQEALEYGQAVLERAGRIPSSVDWIKHRTDDMPSHEAVRRLFGSWSAFKEALQAEVAGPVNHKVVSVRPAGRADVYNGMVDDVHTYVVVDPHPMTANACHSGILSANCGEQPLLPYDVCNLGSVNVGYHVQFDESTGQAYMDWDGLRADIRLATHFLDNVIDANKFPLPEIDALSKRIRRIGLGIMGFADALVRLGIPYDSEEGVEFGRRIMEFLDVESKLESERLATERGEFPEWARSIWGPDETCARDADGNRIRPMQRLRNCNVTTIAPTGTISIIAGCSSGLEPLFAVAFMRNQAGVMMPDVNEDFVRIAREEGWYSEALMARIAKEGTIAFPEVPEHWQRVFVTANQIAPEWHVRMQGAFQQHCDSAISKTTNFAHTASVEDVRAIYELAYDLRCKGVTVYRDGSRDNQVLSTGATDKAKAEREKGGAAPAEAAVVSAAPATDEVERLQAQLSDARNALERVQRELAEAVHRTKRPRPDILPSTSIRKNTPLGAMFVHISHDEQGKPFDMFLTLGKAGGSAMADAEAMGRLVSLCLRSGIPMEDIYKQLRGISSDRASGYGPNKVLSVPDAIALAFDDWRRFRTSPAAQVTPGESSASAEPPLLQPPTVALTGACPDCSSQLEYAEGCVKCHVCGFSECG